MPLDHSRTLPDSLRPSDHSQSSLQTPFSSCPETLMFMKCLPVLLCKKPSPNFLIDLFCSGICSLGRAQWGQLLSALLGVCWDSSRLGLEYLRVRFLMFDGRSGRTLTAGAQTSGTPQAAPSCSLWPHLVVPPAWWLQNRRWPWKPWCTSRGHVRWDTLALPSFENAACHCFSC